MPPSMKPSPHNVRTYRGMGDVSGQERSYSFGHPYLDTKCELKQNTSTEKMGPSKSSENVRKPRPGNNRACDDDNELVKYMSNLPGFLQKMEKKSNIQDKALNFGVLNWKRLEKWKYTEPMPGKYSPQKTSSSSKPRIGHDSKKQSSSSHVRNPSSLYSGKQSVPYGSRFGSPQRQTPPKEDRNASYHKEEKYVELIMSKGKETCNQEYGRLQDHFHQRVKFQDETNVYESKRKDPKKEMMSEKEASSSEQERQIFSLPSHNNNSNVQGKSSEMRFDDAKLISECNPSAPQNSVLIKPKHFRKSSSESSQFTESRTSLDVQLAEMMGTRLSDFFSPQGLKSGEFSISGAVGPNNSVTSQANDLDVRTSTSKSKCPLTHEETNRPSSFFEASDKKQAEVAEQITPKERAPSPTRRFSFNLGRMSRSLSFKNNNSAVPQLSSTYTSVKSGPAWTETSSGTDNFKSDQPNACGRARSSPLRRLLDPLLKHKGAHTAETVSTGTKGPSQDRKPEGSKTLQALLQLTLKNGLPFFKLVVNNSNDMLAAAVKMLPASGKSDSCMIYAFYSVHEIRKKCMNWMNQGSKSKSCGLGYNIVGQMKISSSSEYDVRECVLYGVDPEQVDKQTLEYVPNEEIAAVIVRNSSKMLSDEELSDKSQLYEEREFSHCVSAVPVEPEENKNSSGIVVILPGGVHGIPIKGTPSSLISRWRFGGSCDCGGWDVGCKLRILADDKKSSNSPQASMSSSNIDHINLFLEGGEEKNKPVFSLKPFSNGYYSIEFDASISLLEAFATCVAYVTCSKFPDMTYAKSPSGPEAIVGTDKRKTPTTFQEQLPAYFTCPPLSPAGRI